MAGRPFGIQDADIDVHVSGSPMLRWLFNLLTRGTGAGRRLGREHR